MNNSSFSYSYLSRFVPIAEKIYFVGIGGVSMSSLALLAAHRGHHVAGCDRNTDFSGVSQFYAAGIPIEEESCADPTGYHLVVYSLAVSPAAPAIRIATEQGIPMVSRAAFLAAMTHTYPYRIAVAGMHGKSTTVGMLSAVLTHAGLDPTVLSGAPLSVGGAPFRIGNGDVALVEACEYRDSFLCLRPTLGVVTNIELDHPDYFPDLAAVERSFSRFLSLCDTAVVNGDCPALHALADARHLRFGRGRNAPLGYVLTDGGMTITYQNVPLGTLSLSVKGSYNCENALAATAAALTLGIPFTVIAEALSAFHGVGRRMEYIGRLPLVSGSAAVFLDYAHHPTELISVIRAAHARGGRVLAVFQPHTYSRTEALWDAFISALKLPDYTIITDIYAAREANVPGVTSARLARAAGVAYAPAFSDVIALLVAAARGGDTILILGAGDIDRLATHLRLI